ncbi:hypothetical protein HF086_005115 [Spodoptera exigua]|uniref:RRM domain-containing protein n=1 Tax=Spodoptera exigua TaxID=7107 RepID=A0A922MRS4_SPOEX|nr:hypothetical protein HF086_005115 [Spodoptera exigua]
MADKLPLGRLAMKNPATSHLRIFVGGLQDGVSMDELYNHFIQYGEIHGIVINRNFGFVQFAEESSAQEAILKANGTVFQGRTLSVKTAQTNTNAMDKRHIESAASDMPPAVAHHNDKPPLMGADDGNEELYDNFGNYIGDQSKCVLAKREQNIFIKIYFKSLVIEMRNMMMVTRVNLVGRGGEECVAEVAQEGVDVAAAVELPGFRDRSPISGRAGEWKDRSSYDRYQQMSDYPRAVPVTERNDCEIIVVSKSLTEYAEYIEGRLKRLGIVVDLLFPMEDVPIGKYYNFILCLFLIEHRNMPLEDSLQLLSRNFQEVQRGGPSGREAVYALLGQLADGRTLTVLQYDKVIEYLQERREQQVKIELGEPLNPAPANKTQVDLQQRILSILNEKKVIPPAPVEQPPPAAPTPPAPAPPTPQNKLLSDPTVRKALDSILQKFT